MKLQTFQIFIFYFTFSDDFRQNRLAKNLMLLKLRKYSINAPSLPSETMLKMIGSRTGREELKTFIKNFESVKPTDQRFQFYRDFFKKPYYRKMIVE